MKKTQCVILYEQVFPQMFTDFVLICFAGFVIQQRYVLVAMVFFALVSSIAVRSCLSLTITQMVVKLQVENTTLHTDLSVCPLPVTSAMSHTLSEDVIPFVSIYSMGRKHIRSI